MSSFKKMREIKEQLRLQNISTCSGTPFSLQTVTTTSIFLSEDFDPLENSPFTSVR